VSRYVITRLKKNVIQVGSRVKVIVLFCFLTEHVYHHSKAFRDSSNH